MGAWIVLGPEELSIDRAQATATLLAARDMDELIRCSAASTSRRPLRGGAGRTRPRRARRNVSERIREQTYGHPLTFWGPALLDRAGVVFDRRPGTSIRRRAREGAAGLERANSWPKPCRRQRQASEAALARELLTVRGARVKAEDRLSSRCYLATGSDADKTVLRQAAEKTISRRVG